jgi:hypothetical protein
MATLSDFAKGDRVVLARVHQLDYRGKTGTVRRTVKHDQTVVVDVDGTDPRLTTSIYRAAPENLDKVPPAVRSQPTEQTS